MDDSIFKWLLGGGMAVLSFFMHRLVGDVDANTDGLRENKNDLAEYKLHAERYYANKVDIVELKSDMKEIKGDIKTLIRGEK